MCRICLDLKREALTPAEAYRNLYESVGTSVSPEHGAEVREIIRERVAASEQTAKERLAWESPAGSGEETGV